MQLIGNGFGGMLRGLAGAALVLVASLATAGGSFVATGDMAAPRAIHGAALTGAGTVLVVGGIEDFGVFSTTAELYDPASGTFSLTGEPVEARFGPSVVALADGRVLVLGGRNLTDGSDLASAEIFDPATGTFAATGDMTTGRYVPSVVLLEDGRVLVANGFSFASGPLSSAEIYDPATGTFELTGSSSVVRTAPKGAIRLADGRVLIAGGTNEDGLLSIAEIYDPESGEFSTTGDLPEPREGHSMALLEDGRVLVVGGSDAGLGGGFPNYYAHAVLFDPATGTFTPTGELAFPRDNTTATVLQDGRVLVAGGSAVVGNPGSTTIATAEVYDPATGEFSPMGDMVVPRFETQAVTLPDHRVLFAGGWAFGGDSLGDIPTASAELFVPAAADAIFADGFDGSAPTDPVSNYDDLAESEVGTPFSYNGITYHDVNGIGGVFPDGSTFVPADVGEALYIDDATYVFNDFPDFGSPPNVLNFGTFLMEGPNVSVGALVRVTMDLDPPASAASLDLAYYENGPWGRIVIHLDALDGDTVVASDSLTISDLGGRDNLTTSNLSVAGATFDTLKLYSTYEDQPSAPRILVDDITLTPAD